MMEIHVRPIALAAGCLLLAACASGAGTTDTPTTPAPKPGEPEAPAAPSAGHGPAVTFRAVQGAMYRVERHDSLNLQYEGGASQDQLRDRTAVVRLSLAPGAAAGS